MNLHLTPEQAKRLRPHLVTSSRGGSANTVVSLGLAAWMSKHVEDLKRREEIAALPSITPEQRQDAWDLDMPATEAAALLTSGWPDEDSLAVLRALRGLPQRTITDPTNPLLIGDQP